MGLGTSVEKEVDRNNFSFDYPHDLDPFKRNLKIILHLCELYDIKPIIATIPYSTDPKIEGSHSKTGLNQTNSITRRMAQQQPESILFADLDSAYTGKINEVFTDFAHVTDQGREIKSAFIGNVLLNDSDYWMNRFTLPETPLQHEVSEDRIQFYENMIRSDKKWFQSVINKAKERNISIDEMIRLDAIYMVEEENKSLSF